MSNVDYDRYGPGVILGVDGVVASTRHKCADRQGLVEHPISDIISIIVAAETIEIIQLMKERTKLVWCTTWGEYANIYISRIVGLPYLDVIPRPADDPNWDAHQVAEYIRPWLDEGRDVYWIDDFRDTHPNHNNYAIEGVKRGDTSSFGYMKWDFLPHDLRTWLAYP